MAGWRAHEIVGYGDAVAGPVTMWPLNPSASNTNLRSPSARSVGLASDGSAGTPASDRSDVGPPTPLQLDGDDMEAAGPLEPLHIIRDCRSASLVAVDFLKVAVCRAYPPDAESVPCGTFD